MGTTHEVSFPFFGSLLRANETVCHSSPIRASAIGGEDDDACEDCSTVVFEEHIWEV